MAIPTNVPGLIRGDASSGLRGSRSLISHNGPGRSADCQPWRPLQSQRQIADLASTLKVPAALDEFALFLRFLLIFPGNYVIRCVLPN